MTKTLPGASATQPQGFYKSKEMKPDEGFKQNMTTVTEAFQKEAREPQNSKPYKLSHDSSERQSKEESKRRRTTQQHFLAKQSPKDMAATSKLPLF